MASEVDICNIALGHLGDEAAISAIDPPDGSVQAAHCARIYPMARDELLEMHNWRFAVKRKALALLATTEQPQEWAYTYGYPTCIRVIAIRPANEPTTSNSNLIFDEQEFLAAPKTYPFTVEALDDGTQVIYTNVEDATVHYVAAITDVAKFSPLFRAALARLMAHYLAGPIVKGKVGIEVARTQLELFEKIASPRAKASDANARRDTSYDNFVPSSLAARR